MLIWSYHGLLKTKLKFNNLHCLLCLCFCFSKFSCWFVYSASVPLFSAPQFKKEAAAAAFNAGDTLRAVAPAAAQLAHTCAPPPAFVGWRAVISAKRRLAAGCAHVARRPPAGCGGALAGPN